MFIKLLVLEHTLVFRPMPANSFLSDLRVFKATAASWLSLCLSLVVMWAPLTLSCSLTLLPRHSGVCIYERMKLCGKLRTHDVQVKWY